MSAPVHVYMAYIGAGLDEVWRGITDGDLTAQYRGPCDPNLGLAEYGTRVESDWTPGAPIQHVTRDGSVVADGEVIAIDEPHRLELTFHAHWDPELEAEGPVREVYRLDDELNGLTKLTVELYDRRRRQQDDGRHHRPRPLRHLGAEDVAGDGSPTSGLRGGEMPVALRGAHT